MMTFDLASQKPLAELIEACRRVLSGVNTSRVSGTVTCTLACADVARLRFALEEFEKPNDGK